MSAPALRAPAGTRAVARHYLALLGYDAVGWGLLLAVVAGPMGGGPVLHDELADGLLLFFFLPLGHWAVIESRTTLDAAMPLDRARHELVRVACGAAWTIPTLAATLLVANWTSGSVLPRLAPVTGAGFPGWYPLALVAAGLAWYLLGSAVLLRTRHPGRVLVLLAVLFSLARAGLPSGTWERLMLVHRDPAALAGASAPEWVAGSLLPLAIAWGAVFAAVRLDLRGIRAPAWAAGRLTRLSGRAPVRRAGLRRPPSAATVAWRRISLMRHRMAWPVLVALCVAWRTASRTAGVQDASALERVGELFFGVALFWPVLVWIDRDSPQREFREGLPVGTMRDRTLHAAAGAAWLLLLVLLVAGAAVGGSIAAGTIRSAADVPRWLWLGVPCSVVTVYLFGTITTVLSDSPILIGILSVPVMLISLGIEAPLSPKWALAPVGLTEPERWSPAAAAFWLAVCAAAALGALALTVWGDRHHRFPALADLRRFRREPRRPLPRRSAA